MNDLDYCKTQAWDLCGEENSNESGGQAEKPSDVQARSRRVAGAPQAQPATALRILEGVRSNHAL